jgi:hypothetical protein
MPIANLCVSLHVFEKLILTQITEIHDSYEVDITCANQHGFKKKIKHIDASMQSQSIIAKALDEGKYALVQLLMLSI